MDLTSSLKGEHAVKKAHLLSTNPSFHSASGTTSLALVPTDCTIFPIYSQHLGHNVHYMQLLTDSMTRDQQILEDNAHILEKGLKLFVMGSHSKEHELLDNVVIPPQSSQFL